MFQRVVGSAHTGGEMCRGRESKGNRGYGQKGIKKVLLTCKQSWSVLTEP